MWAGEKLRTYTEFKYVIKFEAYLNTVRNYKHRVMLNRFRLSSHDLEIGKGRYSSKPTKEEEGLCKLENNLVVEDEFHFFYGLPAI